MRKMKVSNSISTRTTIIMTISINTGPPKKRHSIDEQQCSSAIDEKDGNYMGTVLHTILAALRIFSW